jgi:hypothetical protein
MTVENRCFIFAQAQICCTGEEETAMHRQKNAARRVYVKVSSDFDAAGYMQPRSITWADGRTFRIDAIRDFRPAVSLGRGSADRYTVVIHGEERHLYFEKAREQFVCRVGRWYVETDSAG